jgi:hypothetical protein
MADISDVEEAVSGALISVLYPSGISQSSIVGVLCRVYRGWPNTPTLNADLAGGVVNVSVVTDNVAGKTTTRYLSEWRSVAILPGTSATTNGQTISIAGSPLLGDLVGVRIDGSPYIYRIREGDTPDQIAAEIKQAIQGDRPASIRGTSITVPGATTITARVVCDSQSTFESRRQEKDVRVICWCPSPLVRDSVAAAIDYAVNQMVFLRLSDDTHARVVYKNTETYDQAQNALLYRRDIVYAIEYPTVTVLQQPSMLFGVSDTNSIITYG